MCRPSVQINNLKSSAYACWCFTVFFGIKFCSTKEKFSMSRLSDPFEQHVCFCHAPQVIRRDGNQSDCTKALWASVATATAELRGTMGKKARAEQADNGWT
mgnify:CR=1 FL=1